VKILELKPREVKGGRHPDSSGLAYVDMDNGRGDKGQNNGNQNGRDRIGGRTTVIRNLRITESPPEISRSCVDSAPKNQVCRELRLGWFKCKFRSHDIATNL
jgi:hypothetical protein